jgi:tetratricopeptide (TPR) repeat protein
MSGPLCLLAIVKDEEAVIERMMKSALPFIDSYSIVDTGSTDDTKGVIERTLGHLPGKVHDREWVNFGHNRTECIDLARGEFPDKFGLMIDADDTVEMPAGAELDDLSFDYYENPVHFGPLMYGQPHIMRLSKPFYFEGVTHEYLACKEPATMATSRLIYNIGTDSKSRSDNTKSKRDIELLLKEIRKNPKDARSWFYLAQSYKDDGQDKRAMNCYQQRALLIGWDEETFLAKLEAAKCSERLNKPIAETMKLYLDAYEYRPTRAESLFELGRMLRQKERYALAYVYLKRAIETPTPPDRLFLDADVYKFRALDELAISAFYVPGKRPESVLLNKVLFSRIPDWDKPRIIGHLAMCREMGTETWAGKFEMPKASAAPTIPKIIHQIWIGPKPAPEEWMRTWREKMPDWEYRLWDNEAVAAETWECQEQIDATAEWNGKADILRYEILKRFGGVCFDADSECVQPLDDSFLSHQAFACYENEAIFPGRIATGYLGASTDSALMKRAVERIAADKNIARDRAWVTVGPVFFTNLVEETGAPCFVYPARVFIPEHWNKGGDGERMQAPGSAPIFARQFWGSTVGYPQVA